ncbi:MAG: amidase [Candidatus Latescibacteria bacterium]|nr:amidase [Candidatus Latescibacterota bacterium]
MPIANELAYQSAAALARRIRRRELSPVEVVEAAIARIEARNPSLNAFVYRGYDDARQRARQAEDALMSGAQLGPLHGVPTAMKDLIDFKPGWPTTFGGIGACKDFVTDLYCPYAERMEGAGAIILGKTNSPAMGFRGTTDNYLFGPSCNPFDTDKNAGGSSGGSAAAVADGLVSIAEGTDAGGSIRIPAAWCGAYGYRASFGRTPLVSRPNAFIGAAPFIFEGPITRTVEDAALALSVLAGYDARDPFSLDQDIDFSAALKQSIKGWKIAYSPNFDVFPVEPQIAQTVQQAVAAFAEAGAQVEEVHLGIKRSHMELADLWCRLVMPITLAVREDFKSQGIDLFQNLQKELPPELIEWADRCRPMTVLDYFADQAMRSEIYDAIQGVFSNYDLLVSPTLTSMPVDNATDGNTLGPATVDGIEINRLIGWCPTFLTNFSGHPSASIPAGLSDGLPVGMQLIGPRYGDAQVLTASAVFEQLRPWLDSYRTCADRPL